MGMDKIRKQFPVLGQYIYANTAASGLLYDGLLEWRQEHDLDFLISGSLMKMKAMHDQTPQVRKTVARFFNCTKGNVALVPNFSLGLNLLLEGLSKKHKVLLLEDDYPSVNWPFESRDFEIEYVSIDANLEDGIASAVRSKGITVLALSLVQWLNGIQIDMEFLTQLKKEFPDLLIIADGTQFCGITDFDFEKAPLDVLGASGYKWLLAGYGNGFMLFKDTIKNAVAVKSVGFNAANGNFEEKEHIRFAKYFEPGHLDTFNFGSLKYSLEFLHDIGMAKIEMQLKRLSEKAKEEFTALGLLEESVVNRKGHSTIFNIKGSNALYQKLLENDVVCAQRGGGIRLSFHFYNTEKEVDSIVKILKTGM